jgi:hypothetical protein
MQNPDNQQLLAIVNAVLNENAKYNLLDLQTN